MKEKIYTIIFEHDTPAGKSFDVWLINLVLLSVVIVMLETIESLASAYATSFLVAEWIFTVLFTAELLLRLYSSPKPINYIFSFYGVVDLLSILPTYISFFIPGAQSLLVIRSLRMLRIFRILKLKNYTKAGQALTEALMASRPKIIVFLGFITTLVLIMGAVMYLVEDKTNGFTSIPMSVYWAVVTMTTVGYGDITPQTPLGQLISSVLMIVGYGVIAVPTGIISAEISKVDQKATCPYCGHSVLDSGAAFCSNCGKNLSESV